jgi:IQ calmodulin-binding motif
MTGPEEAVVRIQAVCRGFAVRKVMQNALLEYMETVTQLEQLMQLQERAYSCRLAGTAIR